MVFGLGVWVLRIEGQASTLIGARPSWSVGPRSGAVNGSAAIAPGGFGALAVGSEA